jgi:flagellar biosynthesis protein FlhA
VGEGFLVVDAGTVIATHLNQLIGARPQDLLGPDEVRAILDRVKDHAASLVETVHPQPLSLGALTRLLRVLLQDGIPIAHPVPILASLAEAVQVTLDHDRLIDLLRTDLGALVVGQICTPDARLPVVTLDANLESAIVQGLHDPVSGQPLVEPDLARTIGDHVAALMSERGHDRALAMIVQPRARRPLAGLLRLRAPGCLVLSINELPAAQPIEVVAVIGGTLPAPHPGSVDESLAA